MAAIKKPVKMPKEQSRPPEEVPFTAHLHELRKRIVRSVLAIVVFSIPAGIFWQRIVEIIMIHPLRFTNPKPQLIYTSPAEPVMLAFKIAIFSGIFAAAPFIFYQLWRFIAPGLYKEEKQLVFPTVLASSVFFLLGASFCYLTIPYLLKFMTNFSGTQLTALFKIDEYLGFVLKLTLAFGIVFEMPVVSFVLSRMGLLSPKTLIDGTRYAIVIIFIVAAFLTPPDVISQIILAAPLLVLYGISIIVSFFSQGKKR